MNTKWITALTVALSGVVVSGVAGAAEKDEAGAQQSSRELAPATHAVELTIGTGYAQGFGDVASGQPKLTDLAQAGGAVQTSVGYRVIPQLTLGVYGSGAMFSRADQVDSTTNVYSASAGIESDWHFLPSSHQLDPWVSLSSGWRGYWVHNNQAETSLQGLQIARLQLGLDYRIDNAIAISPIIGADLSTFLSERTPTSGGFTNISNPNVDTFLFAGLQGRFDIPTRSGSTSQVASR